jgi:hypothetical protein
MSTSKTLEPFYCIVDENFQYCVVSIHKHYDYNNDRLIYVTLSEVKDHRSLSGILQSNTISSLAEDLHKVNLANQINEIRSNRENVAIKEFKIVKIIPKIEGTILSAEEVVTALDEARMAAQRARQEKINAILHKIDASKLTDYQVHNLEEMLSVVY